MPFCSMRSWRPPTMTQMPMLVDFKPGMESVAMRNPLDRV
jgi:hypothetical protein